MPKLKKQLTRLMQTTFVLFVLFSLYGNDLFAQGMGIGTAAPVSKLDVNGNLTVGAGYAGVSAAPANGAIIEGKVGIGATAPAALLQLQSTLNPLTATTTWANYNLFIYNSVNTNGTGTGIAFANTGTANNVGAAIIFKRTGAFSQGALQFYTKKATTDGTAPLQAMVIDSAQNVGIGIAIPQGRLHIYETTGTVATATAGTLILEHGNSGGESSILFKSNVNVGGDYGYIKYMDDGSLNGATTENSLLEIGTQNDVYGSGFEDDIAIMPSSHLGIGTRGPKSMLDVNGNLTVGAGYAGVTAAPANGAIIQGNVGIGTSAPTAALNIQSSTGAGGYGGILVQASFGNNSSKGAVGLIGARYSNANVPFSGFATWDDNVDRQIDIGGGGYALPDANRIGFWTAAVYNETTDAAVERMRITSSGHVGIGTTAPVTNAILAVKDGHLQSQQTTAPTIATGAASTAASLSNATDNAGNISITTKSATAGIGATITFNKTFTVAPIVIITPTNTAAATEVIRVYVTSTTSTFVVTWSAAAAAASAKTYTYHVIETQ